MQTVTKAPNSWRPGDDSVLNHVVPGRGGCLIWFGRISTPGYGSTRVKIDGTWRCALAHRLAYEELVGPIPDGLVLDHLCRVRRCVNPAHLEPVTILENLMRSPIAPAAVNSRKTHCPLGHEYTPENTYVRKQRKNPDRTERSCLTCRRKRGRDAERRRRARKAAER